MFRSRTDFLRDMAHACDQIAEYLGGLTLSALLGDRRTYDAVSWQLFVIGEAARHIEDEFCGAHPEIPWRRIIGLRNVLAHGYWVIDNETLWEVLSERVPELRAQLAPLLRE